jgi:hypothetical protein
MAEFTRTNGGALPGEFIGRDIKFVLCALTGIHTSYSAVNSNFEKCMRVLSKFCTITVVGTPASNNAMFVVEGLPTDVGGTAIASVLATDADAATSGSTTWTVYNGLSGNTFA